MVKFTGETKVRMFLENSDGSCALCVSSLQEWLAVTENSGNLYFFVGEGKGDNRALDAAQSAIENSKSEEILADKAEELMAAVSGGHHNLEIKGKGTIRLQDARRLLITFSDNPEPALEQVKTGMKEIMKSVSKDAKVFYNWTADSKIDKDVLKIFVVASDK
jgi:cell division GTPase FtsZ